MYLYFNWKHAEGNLFLLIKITRCLAITRTVTIKTSLKKSGGFEYESPHCSFALSTLVTITFRHCHGNRRKTMPFFLLNNGRKHINVKLIWQNSLPVAVNLRCKSCFSLSRVLIFSYPTSRFKTWMLYHTITRGSYWTDHQTTAFILGHQYFKRKFLYFVDILLEFS